MENSEIKKTPRHRKPEGIRKQHQLREHDDEWQIVRAFDKIVKYGNKQAALKFIEKYKVQK